MASWSSRLRFDPIAPLLDADDDAISFFTCRDLLGEETGPVSLIWDLPAVRGILRKQRPDGSWKYPGHSQPGSGVKYPLLETWKQLRFLVDQYGMDRTHSALERATEFVLSCQTDEGDLRGILANQYAPYYHGALLSLLIKAGYGDDPRVGRGLRWLLDARQDDGGWVIGSPGMVGLGRLPAEERDRMVSDRSCPTARAFDRTKPFSAAGTGMAIRALAAHPRCRHGEDALKAARLLKSKLFKEDNWASYRHPDHWVRFQYPFWWTNVVSALDAISLIGIPATDPDVRGALRWLAGHQEENGLWRVSYSRIHKSPINSRTRDTQLWVTLAICRIFKRYYGPGEAPRGRGFR